MGVALYPVGQVDFLAGETNRENTTVSRIHVMAEKWLLTEYNLMLSKEKLEQEDWEDIIAAIFNTSEFRMNH
jgi:hypothetical protein